LLAWDGIGGVHFSAILSDMRNLVGDPIRLPFEADGGCVGRHELPCGRPEIFKRCRHPDLPGGELLEPQGFLVGGSGHSRATLA